MQRQFFGGAITCSLPPQWKDLSNFRQVPDNQECWIDPDSDRLLVVEFLELQADILDHDAARYFFQDLAESNGILDPCHASFISQPTNLWLEGLPNDAVVCVGKGFQYVASGRDFDLGGNRRVQDARWILVELCLIRIRSVGTDVLITLSSPSDANPQDTKQSTDLFKSYLSSFIIRDWSIFQ